MKVLIGMAIAALVFICYLVEMARFQAIQVYYPELTYTEYYLLHDRIRVTPDAYQ